MNCPSRTDEPPRDAGWNQNPPGLSASLTTRQDLNGMVNLRTNQDSSKEADDSRAESDGCKDDVESARVAPPPSLVNNDCKGKPKSSRESWTAILAKATPSQLHAPWKWLLKVHGPAGNLARKVWHTVSKFGKFIGPGFIIAVAYIDPGNYATDVAAGAATRFSLLFIVLMSNVFAIVLQSLAVRLGTVTGMNLAEHCRAHLPRWLNLILYIFGEAAIIATDIAEVCFIMCIPPSVKTKTKLNIILGHWLSNSSKPPP